MVFFGWFFFLEIRLSGFIGEVSYFQCDLLLGRSRLVKGYGQLFSRSYGFRFRIWGREECRCLGNGFREVFVEWVFFFLSLYLGIKVVIYLFCKFYFIWGFGRYVFQSEMVVVLVGVFLVFCVVFWVVRVMGFLWMEVYLERVVFLE